MIAFRTIILQSAIVDKVKQLTSLMAGEEQALNMWATPLSPSGESPATHYISSWMIDEEFALLLPLYTLWEKVYNWQAEMIANATWASLNDIEAMFDCMYVSEEESIDAMNRLGLILTNETI